MSRAQRIRQAALANPNCTAAELLRAADALKENSMSPAEQRDLRERCLTLALTNITADAGTVVSHARDFYAFVTGESDKSPRERIDAALEEAGVS